MIIQGLYRDNGKEHGNCYLGFRDITKIMDSQMENELEAR